MISKELEVVFNKSIQKATELRHEYMTLEIVLWSLTFDKDIERVFTALGVKVKDVRDILDEFLEKSENFSILTDEAIEELKNDQLQSQEFKEFASISGVPYQPEISLSLQRVIQRAALHIQSANKDRIKAINLLVAFFNEKDSFAVNCLEVKGVTRLKIVELVSHGEDAANTAKVKKAPLNDQNSEDSGKKDPLAEYCTNLNDLAGKGRFDPLIGRESELKRVAQILCRRRKNNPLLVGDAGVGKTAIAEGLAQNIVSGQVPDLLKDMQIYRLDMASLLAGTKFRGDFEERMKVVIAALKDKYEDGVPCILFIDEIHTVIGAGSTSGGSLDASNLLKPALTSGEIRCLGSTTYAEFRKFFEKDQGLARRFQRLEVDEPSVVDTIKILEGLKSSFEEHHSVKYPQSIIKACVNLSDKYINDRKLPDKALDVMDEVGSYLQLLPKKRKNATLKDVEHVVSVMAKVPKNSVSTDERNKLRNLERDLKMLIFGQDHAIKTVSDAILLSRSGLGSYEKPIASFLFAGPTGVGKTELAKQLAHNMGVSFQRFDMSEYMEKHSVAKLIGAPPGYVGHDQGGLLTDLIHKNPHCILLLDEIEKAHQDIYNILLQIMDYGKLTDSNGRTSDFRNTVIILTTNAGAKEMDGGQIGLGGGKNINVSKRDQAIKNFFSPEFRNRLDSIIQFNPLGTENIRMIVEKFLIDLEEHLLQQGVAMEVSDDAMDFIGENAYDSKLGARPIARFIDEKIKQVLAKEVLFGCLKSGGKVLIKVKNDEIHFDYLKQDSKNSSKREHQKA